MIHVRRSGAFQSTLPRRERRVSARAPSASQRFQSTLPRRERRADGYERLDVRGHISIHAPAKGATAAFSEFPRCSADFNPRSREGSDILTARKDEHCFHFNPRSREGSDETAPFHTAAQLVFQSTLPRRERPCAATVPTSTPFNFNPRSREGSDVVLWSDGRP